MLTERQIDKFLTTLTNPRFVDAKTDSSILFDGTFNGNKLEFYASPYDSMDYGREIYQKAMEGAYGPIAPYNEEAMAQHMKDGPNKHLQIPQPEQPKGLF